VSTLAEWGNTNQPCLGASSLSRSLINNSAEVQGWGHGRNSSSICRSGQDRYINLLRSRSPFRGTRHREYRNEAFRRSFGIAHPTLMQGIERSNSTYETQNRKAVEDLVMQFRIERAARWMGKIGLLIFALSILASIMASFTPKYL
jgi:hypothetical protein